MKSILMVVAMFGSLAYGQVSASSPEPVRSETVASAESATYPSVNELALAAPAIAVTSQTSTNILPVLKPAAVSPFVIERKYPSTREKKIWMSLILAEHGAATFDAFSTRAALKNGAYEMNPMLRPFAHSPSLYPAIQAFPAAMDYFGWKLLHSQHPVLRKLWWIPQVASTVGSISAGVHNLGN